MLNVTYIVVDYLINWYVDTFLFKLRIGKLVMRYGKERGRGDYKGGGLCA